MPDLAAALRQMLPAGVALGQGDATHPPNLWPGEVLPGAIPARLSEFSAGRSAARAAMLALGHAPKAIPMAADRAPIWPQGLTGSISHCAGACFALVGKTSHYQGLGVDLEPKLPLPFDLWPTILRPEELHALASLPQDQATIRALQIFTAKEAAYKAQYPITGQLFDFQTLKITVENQYFTAEFTQDIGPFSVGNKITGRMQITANFCAAICWIKA
jgi:4'-phosphopantetheinyl transferase EntD